MFLHAARLCLVPIHSLRGYVHARLAMHEIVPRRLRRIFTPREAMGLTRRVLGGLNLAPSPPRTRR